MRVLALRPLLPLALTAAAATAPSAATAAPPQSVPFTLSAVGARDYHRYAVEPGDTVRGTLRVVNRSRQTRVIRLQALDLVTADTGGIHFRPGRPTGVGRWLRLERRDVRLAPGARQRVRYTGRVPANAAPGQRFAGLVALDRAELRASRRAPAGGRSVVLHHLTRLALPVRFTVPGAARRRLAAGLARFAADASGSRIDLPLRDAGGRLVREALIDLAVTDEEGRPRFRHRARFAEFVPRTAIRYPIAWRGPSAEGRYRLVGTITPKGAPVVRIDQRISFTRRRASELERESGVVAAPGSTPFGLVAGLAAALMFALLASAAYVRTRRRLRVLTAATR